MDSTFCVNEWNGKSILGHVAQTNQLNDRKICMNCIIPNVHPLHYDTTLKQLLNYVLVLLLKANVQVLCILVRLSIMF